jgi:hypothetical protein
MESYRTAWAKYGVQGLPEVHNENLSQKR